MHRTVVASPVCIASNAVRAAGFAPLNRRRLFTWAMLTRRARLSPHGRQGDTLAGVSYLRASTTRALPGITGITILLAVLCSTLALPAAHAQTAPQAPLIAETYEPAASPVLPESPEGIAARRPWIGPLTAEGDEQRRALLTLPRERASP